MSLQLPAQTLTWLGHVTPFQPWFGLARPHLQTIVGPYLPSIQVLPQETFQLSLPDGDSLSVHLNAPPDAAIAKANDPKAPVVLVSVHGLAGCHRSPYMQRLAGWAKQRGWYSYRMDLRGAGQSGLDSRYLYHAGRSDDVLTVLRFVKQRHPNGRIFLAGFSLGASITLHLLANQLRTGGAAANLRSAEGQTLVLPAEQTQPTADLIEGAIAVCPPLDLAVSARNIQRGINRLYDQVFARALWQTLLERPRAQQQLGSQLPSRRPATLWDFDQQVTAPLGGFPSAEFYYQRFSTREQVRHVDVPTLVIIAQDDPLIPFTTAEDVVWSPSTKVVVTPHGGHLGFLGRASSITGPKTNRWLELAIVDSIQSHLDQLPS